MISIINCEKERDQSQNRPMWQRTDSLVRKPIEYEEKERVAGRKVCLHQYTIPVMKRAVESTTEQGII